MGWALVAAETPLKKGVNNISSNQFGISGASGDLGCTRPAVWSHFLFVLIFMTLQFLWRTLQGWEISLHSLDYNFHDDLFQSVNNSFLFNLQQTDSHTSWVQTKITWCLYIVQSVASHHERGHGTQRGEPQHPSDEQPRNVAVLHPGHRSPARHLAQHSLRQRTRGLDPHQPHTQSGECSRRPVDTASTTSSLGVCWTSHIGEGHIQCSLVNGLWMWWMKVT